MAFDQSKYIAEFRKENYDRIEILIPKGSKTILKKIAMDHNILDSKGKVSVSRMIVEAVEQIYEVDLSKPE